MATPVTLIDTSGQHIESVVVRHYEARTDVTVRTEHLSIYLPDPIGLWEQLSTALESSGERAHLLDYLNAQEVGEPAVARHDFGEVAK